MLVNTSKTDPPTRTFDNTMQGAVGFEQFCGGELWNRSSVWETEDPELSPCLQVTLLSWLPAGLLLLWSPFEVRSWLANRHPSIPPTLLNITKILTGLCLAGLCVARLVLLERPSEAEDHSEAEYLGVAVILLSYLYSTLLLVLSLR